MSKTTTIRAPGRDGTVRDRLVVKARPYTRKETATVADQGALEAAAVKRLRRKMRNYFTMTKETTMGRSAR